MEVRLTLFGAFSCLRGERIVMKLLYMRCEHVSLLVLCACESVSVLACVLCAYVVSLCV